MNVLARDDLLEVPKEYIPQISKIVKGMSDTKRDWPRYVAINCWHINENESSAMWSLYLKSNEGISIQSTYNKFRESFSKTEDNIYMGKVNYIDYEHQVIENANLYSPFLYKRKSFEHERELRAIVIKTPRMGPKGLDFTIDTINTGILIPIQLSLLIERVYVSPDAPNWFTQLVQSIISKYNQNIPVTQSSLFSAEPLY